MGENVLIQTNMTTPQGQTVQSTRFPAVKRKANENHFDAAKRLIKKTLSLDTNFVTINSSDIKIVEEVTGTSSYPDMQCVYRKIIIEATLCAPPAKSSRKTKSK